MPLNRKNENIITITKMRLVINGFLYPVASVDIQLGQNFIPMIRLTVAPERVAASDVEDDLPLIRQNNAQPTLERFIQHHQELQSLALRDDVPVSFAMRVEQNNTGEVQEIDVSNWVLTGGGVQNLSADGGFLLGVSIKHPAYRCDRASISLVNHASTADIPGSLSGTDNSYVDLVDTYSGIIDTYLTSTATSIDDTDAVVTDPSDNFSFDEDCDVSLKTISTTMSDQLEAALETFTENVVWFSQEGSGDFPFDGDAEISDQYSLSDSTSEYYAKSMWSIVGNRGTPGSGATLWKTFAFDVVPEYELTVTGAPTDDKLLVYPFAPWGVSTLNIKDTEINALTQPPYDNYPVAGIIANYEAGSESDVLSNYKAATSDGASSDNSLVSGLAGFVCPLANGLIGTIRYMSPPTWIQQLPRLKASDHLDKLNHTMNRQRYNKDTDITFFENDGAGSTEGDPATFKAMRAAATLWTEQAFLRVYRSGVNLALSTRLKIQDMSSSLPGGYLRPGVTMSVGSEDESNGSSSILLYFYVTKVHHQIDAQNGTASTTLNGSYVRPPINFPQAGITQDKIIEGLTNPLYGANGSVIV